ncbi:hypothetical protein NY78_4400 [Desulfovibrio sp. TomC]|nr:hypothetical protein NY78_4400 [Desulfovibrio sp. TomC]
MICNYNRNTIFRSKHFYFLQNFRIFFSIGKHLKIINKQNSIVFYDSTFFFNIVNF